MFRQLDYQDRVLAALDAYLDLLKTRKARADKVAALAAQDPDLGLAVPNFSKEAWEAMKAAGKLPASRAAIPFSLRLDGCNHPVPNAVLKVPTGGGKTWLAVSAVSRIMGRYLDRNTGFVLWIVPNEAIYTQTIKRLKDRQHPYRQALDRAAAGRVRIMEKTDRLDVRDVETNLCIMLLMLQSANRETQDSLKMFQDRGDVHGFFPPEGEQQAHQAALDRTPNLSAYLGLFPMVKDSLGNALRIIRPVVVMDEGHRAVSDLAFGTLYGFNPCFVLELTATPQDVQPRGGRSPREGRYANLLVEVTGRELDREGMIKMPLNLDPRQGNDWKASLNAALAKLNNLDAEARRLQADTGRYIRPIMLVQVERTGADQRESGHIHADDVKDWLLTAGFDAAEVAIKTAQQNDLSAPENQDLLSPTNRVRAIITKQALQEGWDCPFAYVLCSLAASSNLKAMTQLIGRILRQPGALKTGVEALDECHVITHHADTASVVEAIKDGLEQDGLGDLVLRVTQEDKTGSGQTTRTVKRRAAFKSPEIYLPKVMLVEGQRSAISIMKPMSCPPSTGGASTRPTWRTVSRRTPKPPKASSNGSGYPMTAKSCSLGKPSRPIPKPSNSIPRTRCGLISDIVINPFVGREIVAATVRHLRARGLDDAKLGQLASLIVEELRKGLDEARNASAEALFKAEVEAGRIQFRLRLDGRNWRMPFTVETSEPQNARQLVNRAGGPLEKSLFSPIYENEFDGDERDVAVYLDGEKALTWWHRNVARTQYGIQGWKKAKIYPDFIFAVHKEGKNKRITILETKGDQLDNLDTAYKRGALNFLSDHFQWDDATPVGELELVNSGETVEGTLILMSEWQAKLPAYL